MDITKLLYNNSDEIIDRIINEATINMDDILRDIFSGGIFGRVRTLAKCLNDTKEFTQYVVNRVMDWLANRKREKLTENWEYFYEDDYGFNN